MSDRWNTPDIVPALVYDDVPSAVDWLARTFGFRERPDARLTWTSGSMTWMALGHGLINLSSDRGREHPITDGGGQTPKVYVDDVDTHYHHAKAAGAVIISEPQDEFWGGRIYRARDLGGYLWEFSQRGIDLAAEDWRLPPGMTRGIQ